jgi:CheY-like chemotaxis protein
MCKRKILIIENQESQFSKLQSLFGEYDNDFEIFPKDFFPFITWVRRYVNKNYPENLRMADGFDKIIQIINDNRIDLILMDYKLGAQFECLSGVILAKEINIKLQSLANQPLPVVFMSKDLIKDNEKYCGELNEYEKMKFPKCRYVHKGYFGKEILQNDYFKDKIISAINYCLLDTELQTVYKIIIDKIENLKHDSNGEDEQTERNLHNILKAIENGEKIKKETIEFIKEKKDSTNFNDFNHILIKEYKNEDR